MAPLDINTKYKLKESGTEIPALGFGVWDSPAHLTEASCLEALKVGYRHIDTAQLYENEKEVGQAVRASGIPRKEIFVTSKIYRPDDTDEENTFQKLRSSVDKVAGPTENRGGYLDLILIHNANVGKDEVKLMWQGMERMVREGRAKAIGASNFGIGHLKAVKEYAERWPPAVNQLELHPWHQQREVTEYCKKEGILLEAYCPLVRNQKAEDPSLVSIAKKHSRTTAQVLLRYSLQKGWIPLPKSDTPSRIKENSEIYDFELDAEDMKELDSKDEGGKGALVLAVSNE